MQQGNPGQAPDPGTSLLLTHMELMLWQRGKAPWPLHPASLLRDSPYVAPRCAANQRESTMLVPAPLPRSIPVTEPAARAAQKCNARAAERQRSGHRDAVPGLQGRGAGAAATRRRLRSPTQPAAAGHQAAADRRQGAICRVPVTRQPTACPQPRQHRAPRRRQAGGRGAPGPAAGRERAARSALSLVPFYLPA